MAFNESYGFFPVLSVARMKPHIPPQIKIAKTYWCAEVQDILLPKEPKQEQNHQKQQSRAKIQVIFDLQTFDKICYIATPMNKKHKGYQDYIANKHGLFEKFLKNKIKFHLIQKFYNRIKVRTINLKLIPNVKFAKKILDIGCGQAETLKFIREYINSDAELHAVDLERSKNLPAFVKFYEVDIEEQKLPFENEYFDTAISTFVLEHLRNPQQLFLETNRVLKKGGYFYCVTENYTSVFLPGRFNFYSDPTHVKPWTKKSLKAVAEMSGFEVVKIGYFRPAEYFLLIPFVPILTLIDPECAIVIYEVFFAKSIYCILKKP